MMAARRRRKSQSQDPAPAEEAEPTGEAVEEQPEVEKAAEPTVAPLYRYVKMRTMGGREIVIRERITDE